MSRENVEIVRSFHKVFERGDRAAWREHFHPDVEWDVTASDMPAANVYRGHGGIEEFFRDWLGTWDDFGLETLELLDAGDAVVVAFRQRGRGRASGVEIDRDFFGVYELAGGKVVRFRLLESRADALSAAGLDDASNAEREGPAHAGPSAI